MSVPDNKLYRKPTKREIPLQNLEMNNSRHFTQHQFNLISKMSKMVNLTNDSLEDVIQSLAIQKEDQFKKLAGGQGEAEDEETDPQKLLVKTNSNIKNLNHLLMQLVAVQQESIPIQKNIPQHFVMMDRVPVFLEIDGANMPFPCKIIMRPNYKKFGYTEQMMNFICNNMVIYVSTKTKNPSRRNNQLMMEPPVKKVINFAPVADGGGVGVGFKDSFQDKIYICINYDIVSEKEGEEKNKDDKKAEAEKELSQINMIMHVSFPKDKEEMKKKRMEALMKKIEANGGQQQ